MHFGRGTLARTLVPLATVLALTAPAVASATVRCVNMSGGDCGGGLTYTSIQGAVNDAVNGDTIRLHPQNYDESVNADAKTLTFDSPGAATITGPDNLVALSMAHGGTVRSLTLVGGNKTDSGGVAPSAIHFASPGDFSLVLIGVHATGGTAIGAGGNAGAGLDVSNGNDAGNDTRVSIDASTFDAGGSNSIRGDGLSFTALGGTLSLSNSVVQGPPPAGATNGLHVTGASDATVTGSRLEGESGARIENTAFTALRDHFVADGPNAYGAGLRVIPATVGPAANRPTTATVVDSLVEALPTGNVANDAAVVAPGAAAAAQLTALGSTFVAEKPGSDGGVVTVQRYGDADPAASIALHNSIVRAFDAPSGSAELSADRAPITADHSAFSSSASRNGGTAPAAGSGTNIAGDPGFVSAIDFSLQPTSPLIDRGDPSIVSPGELDLAGANRALDGDGDCFAVPDIGAYERPAVAATRACGNPAPAPAAPAAAPPVVSGFGADNKVFAPVAKHVRKKKVKHGTRFRYNLSKAAQVAITIEQKLAARRMKGVCGKQTRANRRKRKCTRYRRAGTILVNGNAGANTTPFTGRFKGKALKPGRYRATIVATDAGGAKSAPKRLVLRVLRP